MQNLSNDNPLQRFSGLAETYAQHRPGYPPAILDYLTKRTNLCRARLIVDLGSGTGISSRWLAEQGFSVVGIEPNEEMRTKAASIPMPNLSYQAGQAEATGLGDNSVDLIVAAQAFHWFNPDTALPEMRRALKPGGWVALLWNERDESEPFTQAYSAIIRMAPDAIRMEQGRMESAKALQQSSLFINQERTFYPNQQVLDEEALIGRALSASYAPKEPGEREQFVQALRELYSRYQQNGTVTIQYQTSLDLARKPERTE